MDRIIVVTAKDTNIGQVMIAVNKISWFYRDGEVTLIRVDGTTIRCTETLDQIQGMISTALGGGNIGKHLPVHP